MHWKGRMACLVGALTMTMAAPAPAAEQTRSQFRERAESVCKTGTTRTKGLLQRGFREIKENAVRSAGPKLIRTTRAYEAARARLKRIPKPPKDSADLTAWLNRLGVQNMFLRKAGQALTRARRVQAQGFLSRFVHNGNLANDIVLGFGFKHCLFNRNFAGG